MDFIVWMDYTASAPEKSFGLLDEETGCYIALPIEWEGNLMLTDSTDEEDAVELRTVDENKLVLTLRLASSSENAVGWTRLGVVASRQMQAKLGPDVTIEDPIPALPVAVPAELASQALRARSGCGSQHLLRSRSHPAGRCPNSSSCFRHWRPVVAVAPKGRSHWQAG